MSAIFIAGIATQTMTSREIAELTGKDLSNVHRDIREMLEAIKKDDSGLNHPQEDKDVRGYTTCFYLNRELTDTLLTGYSVVARHRVIARWHKLEAERAKPAFTLPDFTNPAAAARAWADAIEATQAVTIERDHAIATKAQIGDKKVATAMATASAKSRETAKLRALMGEATQSASIIAVENAMKRKFGKQDWRKLKTYCAAAGLSTGKSFNPGMQMNVNTYPAAAWLEVFGVDLVELFGEVAA